MPIFEVNLTSIASAKLLKGLTLQKIVHEILKSFHFIETTLISSDFTDFKVISLILNIYNYSNYYISNCALTSVYTF